MTLFTKCILREVEEHDGVRISVMSRHTLNDGVTPDTRITSSSFDKHYLELSPSPELIGDYYKRGLPWKEFENRFREQMQGVSAQCLLREIAVMAFYEDVTLLCIEDTPEFCHRRILAEECRRLVPKINVEFH